MNISYDFILGIATTVFVNIVTYLFIRIKTRLDLKSTLKYLQVASRLQDNGISDIFPQRSDIIKHRSPRSMSQYIKTAKSQFIYIGIVFPYAKKEGESLYSLLNTSCKVEIIFLSPSIEKSKLEAIASYYSIRQDQLLTEIRNSWQNLMNLRNNIPEHLRDELKLKTHEEILTGSVFLFDTDKESDAKIFLDIKFFGLGKNNSIAIELRPGKTRNTFYERIKFSFHKIRDKALTI